MRIKFKDGRDNPITSELILEIDNANVELGDNLMWLDAVEGPSFGVPYCNLMWVCPD